MLHAFGDGVVGFVDSLDAIPESNYAPTDAVPEWVELAASVNISPCMGLVSDFEAQSQLELHSPSLWQSAKVFALSTAAERSFARH